MAQQIRLSQYIVTYGPGAILEDQRGPRVISRPDIGLFHPNSGLVPDSNLEISDRRMSQGLLAGARIFRLPSNAELGVSDNRYVYRTRPFPSWALCLDYNAHAGHVGILYQGAQCPGCNRQGRRGVEAIRFVAACTQGHLDDVYWPAVVHHNGGGTCGHNGWFEWHGGGGSLAQVDIRCPRCPARVGLGWAYGRSWPCTGRFPEAEPIGGPPVRPRGCSAQARIIQRQATNLRIPELRTLFTIPPRATRLHNLLQLREILAALSIAVRGGLSSTTDVANLLDTLIAQGLVQQATANEILRHPWPEISQAVQDVLAPVGNSFVDMLTEEFQALRTASANGYPGLRGSLLSQVIFEVNSADVRRFAGPNGRSLRVTPISRLRTVTVQVGYRREIRSNGQGGQGTPAALVPVSFTDARNSVWYPGVEFLGEGLFIMLEGDDGWHYPLQGSAPTLWESAYRVGNGYPANVFRTPSRDELHPVFVWWHTLSHLLIRAISVDAGYSSASLRERVYVEIDTSTGRARGGVILYATQPGSEGSMGGMIALAPRFDRILDRAWEMARVCSNDPLCHESHFAQGAYGGPACYGCSLLSETSCEHRNFWLDRENLMDNLP